MKLKIITVLALVLVILLSGCSTNETKPDNSSTNLAYSQKDAQENCLSYYNDYTLAENESSYFYKHNSYIYVIDKATHKCCPLCAKPDCKHEKELTQTNCNAFSMGEDSIAFYYGKLYYSDCELKTDENGVTYEVHKICKMNPDGTNKTEVFSTKDFYIWSFKVHRGYIYFDASDFDEDGGADSTKNNNLYRVNIGSSKYEKIFDFKNSPDISNIRFFGDNIFITAEKIDKKNNVKKYAIRYDILNNTFEDLNEKLKNPINDMFFEFNNQLVYACDSKVYACNFDGTNETQVLDCEKVAGKFDWYNVLSGDGNSLLITASNTGDFDSQTLIVCDKNYNTSVYKLPIKARVMAFCDSDSMIVCIYRDENKALYYIDKTKLGSDDCAEKIYSFEE